jgi:nitrite reductase/ring-hydroxylating ferredoxin subunit
MSQAGDWVRVASVADMREGEGYDTGMEVAGDVVGLFLIDGSYYAVGECTHEKGPICQGHREGFAVSCPWHSAQFNIATGECLRGPVACRTDGSVNVGEMEEIDKVDDLNCFDVKLEGEEIFVRPRVRDEATRAPADAGRVP